MGLGLTRAAFIQATTQGDREVMATKAFEISTSIVSAELGGEGVLLDVGSGRYYGLDEIGHTIWRLVCDGLGASAIRERLLAEYDVEPDRLGRDVTAFLSELQENQLIRPHRNT